MLKHVLINDFRNIKKVDFTPSRINVIYGLQGSGKTSFLDAIALADSANQEFKEFSSLLNACFRDKTNNLSLEQLIELSFFCHESMLETFNIRLGFKNSRNKVLEIWKTNKELNTHINGKNAKSDPFIFVFSSPELKTVIPKVVSYGLIEQTYDATKLMNNFWPIHYLSLDSCIDFHNLYVYYSSVSRKQSFNNSIEHLIDCSDHIDDIKLYHNGKEQVLFIKTTDRDVLVPLYTCRPSIVRMVSLLILLHINDKPYFLIDDIERHLTMKEIEWLTKEIYKISLEKNTQLFISTSSILIAERFKELTEKDSLDMKVLNLYPGITTRDLNQVLVE